PGWPGTEAPVAPDDMITSPQTVLASGGFGRQQLRFSRERSLLGQVDLVLPVILAGKIVRREPGQLERHDLFGVGLLAVDDLPIERVLRRILSLDLFPLVEKVLQDLVGRTMHLNAPLDQVLAGLRRL